MNTTFVVPLTRRHTLEQHRQPGAEHHDLQAGHRAGLQRQLCEQHVGPGPLLLRPPDERLDRPRGPQRRRADLRRDLPALHDPLLDPRRLGPDRQVPDPGAHERSLGLAPHGADQPDRARSQPHGLPCRVRHRRSPGGQRHERDPRQRSAACRSTPTPAGRTRASTWPGSCRTTPVGRCASRCSTWATPPTAARSQVLPPAEFASTFSGCTFSRDDNANAQHQRRAPAPCRTCAAPPATRERWSPSTCRSRRTTPAARARRPAAGSRSRRRTTRTSA